MHSIVISSLLFLSKVHLNLRGTHFSPNFFKARPQEEAKEYLRGGRGDVSTMRRIPQVGSCEPQKKSHYYNNNNYILL